MRLTVPVKGTAATDAEARRKAEAERLEAEKRAEQERLAEEQRKAEEARLAAEKAEAEKAAQQNTLADTPSETKITTDYHLSLRANLLRWATLTPDFRRGMAHLPVVGHCRKRLVDFMDVERQGPPLCTLGSGSGSALLYG